MSKSTQTHILKKNEFLCLHIPYTCGEKELLVVFFVSFICALLFGQEDIYLLFIISSFCYIFTHDSCKTMLASQVYAVDFGARFDNLSRRYLRPIEFINYALSTFPQAPQHLADEANAIITLPFRAICCQLNEKRESTHNTETLKALLLECLDFRFVKYVVNEKDN